MLTESLMVLAAAGGTAVVQAAGTDAWAGFRDRMAAWFGRGEEQREQVELERLDRSASDLTALSVDSAGVRSRHETIWQTRIADFLEELPHDERDEAAATLRAVLQEAGASVASAGTGGAAAGRDMNVQAHHGSFAAGAANVEGGVQFGNPPQPGPEQP